MRRLFLACTAALTILMTPAALASGSAKPQIAAAHSSTLSQTIVVDGHGLTAYRLDPETAGRLLCSGSCLSVWRPVKAPSKKSKLRAGDSGPGDTSGEGITSFGGTWKALAASSGSGIAPPASGSSSPGSTLPNY